MQNILTYSFTLSYEYYEKRSIKILKSADNEIPIIFFNPLFIAPEVIYTILYKILFNSVSFISSKVQVLSQETLNSYKISESHFFYIPKAL